MHHFYMYFKSILGCDGSLSGREDSARDGGGLANEVHARHTREERRKTCMETTTYPSPHALGVSIKKRASPSRAPKLSTKQAVVDYSCARESRAESLTRSQQSCEIADPRSVSKSTKSTKSAFQPWPTLSENIRLENENIATPPGLLPARPPAPQRYSRATRTDQSAQSVQRVEQCETHGDSNMHISDTSMRFPKNERCGRGGRGQNQGASYFSRLMFGLN